MNRSVAISLAVTVAVLGLVSAAVALDLPPAVRVGLLGFAALALLVIVFGLATRLSKS